MGIKDGHHFPGRYDTSMTSDTWHRPHTPAALINLVRKTASARKYRLVAATVCAQACDHFGLVDLKELISSLTSFAEGTLTPEGWNQLSHGIERVMHETESDGLRPSNTIAIAMQAAIHPLPEEGCRRSIQWMTATMVRPFGTTKPAKKRSIVQAEVGNIIREIFANPIRPPWYPIPDWMGRGPGLMQPDGRQVSLSWTAQELARGIDADQAFDRMPILADALEEAGLTDLEFLDHCRQGGPHLRGCWALDLVLGKS